MEPLRARVHNGRLVMDEPTDLPDGCELRLSVIDAGDDFDEEERAELHRALEEGMAQANEGQSVDASIVLRRLGIG